MANDHITPRSNLRTARVIGRTFGRLTAVRDAGIHGGRSRIDCVCECGVTITARRDHLESGVTRSCGCWKRDERTARKKHGDSCRGGTSPEYVTWSDMIQRCHNPRQESYQRYGGRGITVCDEWRASFEAFLAHVGRRPGPEYSIDRIDNGKGYEPGNVRWATRAQQARNKSINRVVTYNGRTLCLMDWANELGFNFDVLHSRLGKLGWTVERAFTTPMQVRESYTSCNGCHRRKAFRRGLCRRCCYEGVHKPTSSSMEDQG